MPRRRFMLKPHTERRIMYGAFWFIAGCVILAILTSCSPYHGLQIATPTATAKPTATTELLTNWTASPTPRPTRCTVNAAKVYLRSGAGMSHAVIDVLHSGDMLRVLNAAAWMKVETSQRVIGWVYSKYCTPR